MQSGSAIVAYAFAIFVRTILGFEKLCHGWSTVLNCVQEWGLYGGPIFVAPTAVHANMLYTKDQTPLVRFVVDLLQIYLWNMSATNRTSGVWASTCTYVLKAGSCRSV